MGTEKHMVYWQVCKSQVFVYFCLNIKALQIFHVSKETNYEYLNEEFKNYRFLDSI